MNDCPWCNGKVYKGNSIQHWYSKAMAYRQCIERIWILLNDFRKDDEDNIEKIIVRLIEENRSLVLERMVGK